MAKQTKKSDKQAKIPAPKVRMVSKTVGVLSVPIHVPDTTSRLPDDINQYAAPSYAGGRPESKQEAEVRRLHSAGLSIVRISINTGLKLFSVAKILGLPTDTKDFELATAELAEWNRV